MPLQTSLDGFPTTLQPGQQVTVQSQNRAQIQVSCDLVWSQSATEATYGTIVSRELTGGNFNQISTATKDTQLGVVMYNPRFFENTGYKQYELLNLETVGDRWIRTIAGITANEGDPVFVYVTGANAGKISNVADATPANTKKLSAYFMKAKPVSQTVAAIAFNLLSAPI